MRKLFKLLALLFIVSTASAQLPAYFPSPNSNGYYKIGYLQTDSALILARRNTSWLPKYPSMVLWQRAGTDSTLWYHNGGRWLQVGAAGSVGVSDNIYTADGTIDDAIRTVTVGASSLKFVKGNSNIEYSGTTSNPVYLIDINSGSGSSYAEGSIATVPANITMRSFVGTNANNHGNYFELAADPTSSQIMMNSLWNGKGAHVHFVSNVNQKYMEFAPYDLTHNKFRIDSAGTTFNVYGTTIGIDNIAPHVAGIAPQVILRARDDIGEELFEIRANRRPENGVYSGSLYFGKDAGQSVVLNAGESATNNTAFGSGALSSNTTGFKNTVFGSEAATSLTTGSFNTVVGNLAFGLATTGSDNTAVGQYALGGSTTTGNYNIAVGSGAMSASTSAGFTVAIGGYAGANSSGSNNVYIGRRSGSFTTGDGNVFIGALSGYATQTVSNRLIIHNSNATPPLLSGQFDTRTFTVDGTQWITSLDTDLTPPPTTGTTKMVVSDDMGKLSFEDKPVFVEADNLHTVTSRGDTTSNTIRVKALSTSLIVADSSSTESVYEIAIFPDIQNMIRWNQSASRAMFQWVKDNYVSENIKAVIQVGDVTDWATQAEWDTANAQFGLLDDIGIPYIAAIGNHDYDSPFNPATRQTTAWNNTFGVSRFSAKPWYGGNMGGTHENYHIKFDVGKKKYFVLALEFLPRDAVLSWANTLIDSLEAADPDREVMVVTHAHITFTGELATDTSTYSTDYYGMTADNSGQEVWDKFLKLHKNIKYVFSGHYIIPATNAMRGLTDRITATGVNGNLVHQIFVNYQDDNRDTGIYAAGGKGGNGFLMRIKFDPTTNDIRTAYYSPKLNLYDNPMNEPADTISYPNIRIASSVGISQDLSVAEDVRVGSELKVETLQQYSVPYVTEDHKLTGTPSGDASGVGITYNYKPFRYGGAASTLNNQPVFSIAGQLNIRSYEGAGTQANVRAGGVYTSTYFGASALRSDVFADHFQNWNQNSAFGFAAMRDANGAANNDAFGGWALANLEGGTENSAFGRDALGNLISGTRNSSFGLVSLYDLIDGTYNTAIGNRTGRGITTGDYNTIVGASVSGLPADLQKTVIIASGEGGAVAYRMYSPESGNVLFGGTTDNGIKVQVYGGLSVSSVPNATGNFLTINATTGALQQRTAAEVSTDLGIPPAISEPSTQLVYGTGTGVDSDPYLTWGSGILGVGGNTNNHAIYFNSLAAGTTGVFQWTNTDLYFRNNGTGAVQFGTGGRNGDLLITSAGNIETVGTLKVGSIAQDDTETKIVVWNSTDKVFEYRDASTLGGGGSYTDEMAQDAIGAMVSNEFTYTDATPSLAINQIDWSKIINEPTFLTNITGLVSSGTNVTVTGTGTSGDPYVINSSGGTVSEPANQVVYGTGTGVDSDADLTFDGTTFTANSNVQIGNTDNTTHRMTITKANAADGYFMDIQGNNSQGTTIGMNLAGISTGYKTFFSIYGSSPYLGGGGKALMDIDVTQGNNAFSVDGYKSKIYRTAATNLFYATTGFKADIDAYGGTAYGIYVDAVASNGGNAWGVYSNSGNNYFAGRVAIGQNTFIGSEQLLVNGGSGIYIKNGNNTASINPNSTGGTMTFAINGQSAQLDITRTNATGIDNLFRFYDATSGGYIQFGGAASADFFPKLDVRGSSTFPATFLLNTVPNGAEHASFAGWIIDARLAGGALTTQDILHVQSYDNTGNNLKLRVRANGSFQMPVYGDGTITGTATYGAAFDANGNLIEVALGGGSYTDEQAQDAIGAMVSNEFTYTDATPLLEINSVALAKIANADDLKAIEALAGTTGLLRKTAANTWELDNNTYLTSYTETDPVWTAASSNYYTQTNLQTSGQAAVHWDNITNEPAFLTSETDPSALKIANNLSDLNNAATARTNLGGTTVGQSFFTTTNPSAITFPKVNANNTVTYESAATHRTSIGGTTVGQNLFTLTNPSALGYLRVNADNSITHRAYADVKTDLSLNNVDNTSDATKNAATATLTNKTIDHDLNTIVDMPRRAAIGLTSPNATERWWLFQAGGNGATATSASVVLSGTSPSVTYAIHYGTTYGTSQGTIVSSNTVNTTGFTTATINTSAIPANAHVWLDITAVSGTIDGFVPNLNWKQ